MGHPDAPSASPMVALDITSRLLRAAQPRPDRTPQTTAMTTSAAQNANRAVAATWARVVVMPTIVAASSPRRIGAGTYSGAKNPKPTGRMPSDRW